MQETYQRKSKYICPVCANPVLHDSTLLSLHPTQYRCKETHVYSEYKKYLCYCLNKFCYHKSISQQSLVGSLQSTADCRLMTTDCFIYRTPHLSYAPYQR